MFTNILIHNHSHGNIKKKALYDQKLFTFKLTVNLFVFLDFLWWLELLPSTNMKTVNIYGDTSTVIGFENPEQ